MRFFFTPKVTRRKFLEGAGVMGSGLWLSRFLPFSYTGCGEENKDAVNRSPDGEETKVKVSIARGATVFDSVRQAVDLIGGLDFIRRGETVLIKPNLNSPDPYPATTNPEIVSAVVRLVRERDPARVIVGDRSWIRDTTDYVFKITGMEDAARDAGAEVIPFDDLDWVKVEPPQASHWRGGFSMPSLIQDIDHIISLPVAKTHFIATYTMALKNWVGLVSPADRVAKLHIREDEPRFGNMIAEIHSAVQADFYIMDATRVFVTGGPYEGDMREPGLIIASRDPIANDVTGLALLKYLGTEDRIQSKSVWEQSQVMRAVELGLGVKEPSEIGLLGYRVPELGSIKAFIRQ